MAGGHQTTVAEALPPIARGLVGAPTVVLAAALVAVAGQDASVPDGFDWAALTAVLAASDAALTAAAVLASPAALAAPGDLAELAALAALAEAVAR